MEDNKYYTPKLEELTVNFEYEVFEKNNWVKKDDYTNAYDYEDSCLYGFIKDLENGKIRAKYLDREDIESLGWNHKRLITDDWFKMNCDIELGDGWYSHSCELQYGYHDKRMVIRCKGVIADWGNEIFRGKIKNKSELKRLMTQLGICR